MSIPQVLDEAIFQKTDPAKPSNAIQTENDFLKNCSASYFKDANNNQSNRKTFDNNNDMNFLNNHETESSVVASSCSSMKTTNSLNPFSSASISLSSSSSSNFSNDSLVSAPSFSSSLFLLSCFASCTGKPITSATPLDVDEINLYKSGGNSKVLGRETRINFGYHSSYSRDLRSPKLSSLVLTKDEDMQHRKSNNEINNSIGVAHKTNEGKSNRSKSLYLKNDMHVLLNNKGDDYNNNRIYMYNKDSHLQKNKINMCKSVINNNNNNNNNNSNNANAIRTAEDNLDTNPSAVPFQAEFSNFLSSSISGSQCILCSVDEDLLSFENENKTSEFEDLAESKVTRGRSAKIEESSKCCNNYCYSEQTSLLRKEEESLMNDEAAATNDSHLSLVREVDYIKLHERLTVELRQMHNLTSPDASEDNDCIIKTKSNYIKDSDDNGAMSLYLENTSVNDTFLKDGTTNFCNERNVEAKKLPKQKIIKNRGADEEGAVEIEEMKINQKRKTCTMTQKCDEYHSHDVCYHGDSKSGNFSNCRKLAQSNEHTHAMKSNIDSLKNNENYNSACTTYDTISCSVSSCDKLNANGNVANKSGIGKVSNKKEKTRNSAAGICNTGTFSKNDDCDKRTNMFNGNPPHHADASAAKEEKQKATYIKFSDQLNMLLNTAIGSVLNELDEQNTLIMDGDEKMHTFLRELHLRCLRSCVVRKIQYKCFCKPKPIYSFIDVRDFSYHVMRMHKQWSNKTFREILNMVKNQNVWSIANVSRRTPFNRLNTVDKVSQLCAAFKSACRVPVFDGDRLVRVFSPADLLIILHSRNVIREIESNEALFIKTTARKSITTLMQSESLLKAMVLMERHGYSAIPLVSERCESDVLGVITVREIKYLCWAQDAHETDDILNEPALKFLSAVRQEGLMPMEPYRFLHDNASLEEMIDVFLEGAIKNTQSVHRIILTNINGRMNGMITLTDVMRSLANILGEKGTKMN